MDYYVATKMAEVGAGAGDTREASEICDNLKPVARDILDCWHNLGIEQDVAPEYKHIAQELKSEYSNDDLMVLGVYVNARRNFESY